MLAHVLHDKIGMSILMLVKLSFGAGKLGVDVLELGFKVRYFGFDFVKIFHFLFHAPGSHHIIALDQGF